MPEVAAFGDEEQAGDLSKTVAAYELFVWPLFGESPFSSSLAITSGMAMHGCYASG